jgi:arylsulfatase A-like enzyme
MPGRPSILWIVTTQWRADALGCAGAPSGPNLATPGLDALAAAGVRFARAVTPHPFGPFARAAMLTGVPSPENGVRDYFDPLPESARTVAHALGDRGYATGFFGKWHLGRRDPAAPLVGDAHAKTVVPPGGRGGFGFWEGFESGFLLNDPWLHGTRLPEPTRFEGYQADVVCGRTAEWFRWPGNQPRFAVVSLEAPHPPYDAPAAGVRPRDPRAIILPANVPRGGDVEARARRELAGYYAHLEATDRAIGRLLAAVGAAGSAAPIVVFTSVHGDMHGAHGLFRKGWPYEESIRVPLLIRGWSALSPTRWAAPSAGQRVGDNALHLAPSASVGSGSQSDALVSLIDLPRWTLAWADSSAEFSLPHPGHQLISMPSVVRLPRQCDRTWRGVRTTTRKLVLNADGSPWLLFDLENDPMESRNLAGDPAWAAEIATLRSLATPSPSS